MKGSETDPKNIWNSEIFGRSLDVIVHDDKNKRKRTNKEQTKNNKK